MYVPAATTMTPIPATSQRSAATWPGQCTTLDVRQAACCASRADTGSPWGDAAELTGASAVGRSTGRLNGPGSSNADHDVIHGCLAPPRVLVWRDLTCGPLGSGGCRAVPPLIGTSGFEAPRIGDPQTVANGSRLLQPRRRVSPTLGSAGTGAAGAAARSGRPPQAEAAQPSSDAGGWAPARNDSASQASSDGAASAGGGGSAAARIHRAPLNPEMEPWSSSTSGSRTTASTRYSSGTPLGGFRKRLAAGIGRRRGDDGVPLPCLSTASRVGPDLGRRVGHADAPTCGRRSSIR